MYNSVPESLAAKISEMEPAGLNNLDPKFIADRIDLKYVLPSQILPELLGKLNDSYKVLEVNGTRISTSSNIYFDTPEFKFFLQHVKRKPERYKIRHRTYNESLQTFLEIKKKTRKDRTQKLRLQTNADNVLQLTSEEIEFLRQSVPEHYHNLNPVFRSSFKRISLLGTDPEEKITIDFAITFNNLNGITEELPYLSVVEIKKTVQGGESVFSKLLKTGGFRSSGFSKYCIGLSLVRTMPHTNILKNKLILLKKLRDEYSRPSGS